MAKKKEEEMFEDDDDWFEDDDWEEEEKPKKKSKKKKSKNYTWAWILGFIIILVILLLVRYKFAAPDATNLTDEESTTVPEPEHETEYVPEPSADTQEEGYESDYQYDGDQGVYSYDGPKDLGPDVINDEEMETGEYKQESQLGEPTNEDPQHARDLTAEPELFSNIMCEYDYNAGVNYIGLRIYNVLDEDILISPKGVAKGYNTYFMIRGIVDTDPGCGTEVLHPDQYTECKKIGFDGERYGNVAGINRISVEVPGSTEALLVDCPEKPVFDDE